MASANDVIKTMAEALKKAQEQIIEAASQASNIEEFQARNLGKFGEKLTERELKRVDGNHQVLRNLYVPYKGKTAEIDLVMVHEKGVFVFESKNYSGWIFGTAQQQYWTQSLSNGEKNRFYNPILQNATHIAALAEYLKIPRKEFFSYIVFSERCSLKKTPPNTDSVAVLNRDALSAHLDGVLSILPPIYNQAVVQSIANILYPLTVQDKEAKAKHVETVQASKERAQNSAVCPLCGGTLIKRRGRYGEFWGCSSYPNCKFTRNIEKN